MASIWHSSFWADPSGVRLDRGPQHLDPISAPGGLRPVRTAVGDFGERVQYGDEKPTVPDAFAVAVRADLVHAIVPIAGAHQGQAMRPHGEAQARSRRI